MVNMLAIEEIAFDDLEGGAWRTKVVQAKITTQDLLKLIAIAQETPTTFPAGSKLCFEGNNEPLRVRDIDDVLLLELPPTIASLQIDNASVYSRKNDLRKGTIKATDWTTATFALDLTDSALNYQLEFGTNALVNSQSSWKSPATEAKISIKMKIAGTGHVWFKHPLSLPTHDYGSPTAFFSGSVTLKGMIPAY